MRGRNKRAICATVKSFLRALNRYSRLGRIAAMFWDKLNEPPQLVLYLVWRTKIVVSVLTLRLGRIRKVYLAKPHEPANLALYLVRRTKIVVSVLTLQRLNRTQLLANSTLSLPFTNCACGADVAFSSWIYYSSFAPKKGQRKKIASGHDFHSALEKRVAAGG